MRREAIPTVHLVGGYWFVSTMCGASQSVFRYPRETDADLGPNRIIEPAGLFVFSSLCLWEKWKARYGCREFRSSFGTLNESKGNFTVQFGEKSSFSFTVYVADACDRMKTLSPAFFFNLPGEID